LTTKIRFGVDERKRVITLVQLFGDLSVAMHVTDVPQMLTGGRIAFNDGMNFIFSNFNIIK